MTNLSARTLAGVTARCSCGLRLAPPALRPEACWYCNADLCVACWEERGHCGHPEADAITRGTALATWDQRHAIARAIVEGA